MDAAGRPPETRFAPARGARLAYQIFGEGEHTVVAIPPTAQNVEMSWEQPAIRAMLERFGSFCRYLHFDKRGTGCSDRRSRIADIDERVDDLRAVMDHADLEHAYLFGNSEGGPMTLLFAATYPDRVDGLILSGTGASLMPPDMTEEDLEAQRELIARYAARWGTEDSPVAMGMAPTLSAQDPSFPAWHRRYERFAASQDSLIDLLELSLHVDLRELAPTIDIPTLILHRTDDRVVPVERARELAALLPNARLVEQPGEDHFSYSGDVDGWIDEFERFVTGEVTSRPVGWRRPSVRIRTFGGFSVEVDGVEVPLAAWGSRLARQLCKRLVAARGWPVTRDELFELLWPDETDRRKLGARLSVQLSTVRRILHGGVIADRETIKLDLHEVQTDLEEFHRARTDAEIVAAYHGDLLPEDVYEAWTDGPRSEARTRFTVAAHRHAETALEAGDLDTALEVARRMLDVDRYDEQAHLTSITALLRLGEPRRAAAAHDVYVTAMTELELPVRSIEELV